MTGTEDPRLFGLDRTNLSFAVRGEGGWGKNKFNNAFPISLLCYMHSKGLDLPYIRAETVNSVVQVGRSRIAVSEVLGAVPELCIFDFEGVFPPFDAFVAGSPNKSDVIVQSLDLVPLRALEIKLTVVPDNATAQMPHDVQASEFVTRPLMVELLATNICMAYGTEGRTRLNETLLTTLGNPNNWEWLRQEDMLERLHLVKSALERVLSDPEVSQTPMVVQPVWRTEGQTMILEEQCFDVFIWSDFGVVLLYLSSIVRHLCSRVPRSRITREARSAVWLTKMLWDYSTAGQLTMSEVTKEISFGKQQDKAGTFSGKVTFDYLNGPELSCPRVPKSAVGDIILNGGVGYLRPERRLDATLLADGSLAGAAPRSATDP
jgi:hypothetical protein|tara:strand:+ start:1845 stop:2972 length:1128 start_codon:yes stop_codon:yes gene_type:complete